MNAYAAFLRGINVGGTGKLPMTELRSVCEELGFADVRTYIQSGNVVFRADDSEAAVRSRLEEGLTPVLGRRARAHLRDAPGLRGLLDTNPFPDAPPNRVLVYLMDEPIDPGLANITGPAGEEVRIAHRALFVHYPEGQGRSKLSLPVPPEATARNLNTVRRVLALLADLE